MLYDTYTHLIALIIHMLFEANKTTTNFSAIIIFKGKAVFGRIAWTKDLIFNCSACMNNLYVFPVPYIAQS